MFLAGHRGSLAETEVIRREYNKYALVFRNRRHDPIVTLSSNSDLCFLVLVVLVLISGVDSVYTIREVPGRRSASLLLSSAHHFWACSVTTAAAPLLHDQIEDLGIVDGSEMEWACEEGSGHGFSHDIARILVFELVRKNNAAL